MGQTFQQLGQLLFNSIPTILIFVLLHFYLKRVLYRPLRQVLSARAARIEGKLETARQTMAVAEQKLAGYEEALRQRRVESYHRIEARRQAALAEGQQALADARHQSAQALVQARQQLAAETTQARAHLQAGTEALAAQILSQVLGNKASNPQAMTPPGAGA